MENKSNEIKEGCKRMQINDTKAGMQNIDKDKINSIILKHSQNSKYYKKQQIRDNEIRSRANDKLKTLTTYSFLEIDSAQKIADAYISKIEKKRDFTRVLVHIDMDAFYANVEIKDNPELATKPMAVGSESMLSTSNYIARRYGVRAAMPGFIAKELCPELIIVPCHFTRYQAESKQIMEIISEYDTNYSAASLDEAYVDLTEHLMTRSKFDSSKRTFPLTENDPNETVTFGTSDEECVQEIRHRIFLRTKLTASAGIACNLRLAKLCSDINKPNGQFKLDNNTEKIVDFIEKLPIRKINGIGPSTSLLLECYGIFTCKDLYDKRAILYLFETQNTFEFLMTVCRGFGHNRIEHDGVQKSLGHETTFSAKNANNIDEHLRTCLELSKQVSKELLDDNLMTQKVNLKIKTTDFHVFTRTKSLTGYTDCADKLYDAAKFLLLNEWETSNKKLKLRLIGVRVSDLKDRDTVQLEKHSISTSKSNIKIDSFFKKIDKSQSGGEVEEDEDCSIQFHQHIYSFCPHCQCSIEGNNDFVEQHIDLCSM